MSLLQQQWMEQLEPRTEMAMMLLTSISMMTKNIKNLLIRMATLPLREIR